MERYYKERFGKVKIFCPLTCWDFMQFGNQKNTEIDKAKLSETAAKIRDRVRNRQNNT